jgi:proteasome lid subunit RPN8/RPN11
MSTSSSSVDVRLSDPVRNEIYDHVWGELEREVGGVLIGHYPSKGPRTVVSAVIPALRATGARTSLTFTHDAWQDVHRELERYPGEQIVGWYHSHPGFGIFLSQNDLFIHRNFFSGIRQTAFVVDPYAAQEGWFGWREGKVVAISPELHAARDPSRPARGQPKAPALGSAPPGGPWVERLVYALTGIALGVAIWAGVLHHETGRAHSTPSGVSHAHPITVEPTAGGGGPPGNGGISHRGGQ